MMTATDILEEAIGTLEARGAERDQEGERSMGRAVEIFNEMSTMRTTLLEMDGWKFMIALKFARAERSDNPDHYIDLAGYIALLGEHVLGQHDPYDDIDAKTDGFPGDLFINEDEPEEAVNTASREPLEYFFHTCMNCGEEYRVSPSIQHCPSCYTHVTYTPL